MSFACPLVLLREDFSGEGLGKGTALLGGKVHLGNVQ